VTPSLMGPEYNKNCMITGMSALKYKSIVSKYRVRWWCCRRGYCCLSGRKPEYQTPQHSNKHSPITCMFQLLV